MLMEAVRTSMFYDLAFQVSLPFNVSFSCSGTSICIILTRDIVIQPSAAVGVAFRRQARASHVNVPVVRLIHGDHWHLLELKVLERSTPKRGSLMQSVNDTSFTLSVLSLYKIHVVAARLRRNEKNRH